MKPPFLLAAAGVAIVTLIGYHRIHGGQQAQVRLIQTQLAKEQADQEAQREAAMLLRQLETYRQRLPQALDESWLVRHVTAAAQAQGIELSTISQQQPQSLKAFTRLSAKFQFSATYHQVGQLVAQLEGGDTFLRVESLKITSPAEEENGRAAIEMTMGTLYMPPVTVASVAPGSKK